MTTPDPTAQELDSGTTLRQSSPPGQAGQAGQQDPSFETKVAQQPATSNPSRKKLFLVLFFLGLLVCAGIIGAYFLLSSEDEEPEPEPTPIAQACDFEGVTYEDGETFDAGDGCNSCICEDGVANCTVEACEEDSTPETKTKPFDLSLWSISTRTKENAIELTGEMPEDAKATVEEDVQSGETTTISNNNFTLVLSDHFEGDPNSYKNYVDLGKTGLGEVLRVQFTYDTNNDKYQYVTKDKQFNATGNCSSPAFGDIPAPCGVDLISYNIDALQNFLLSAQCTASSQAGLDQCDQVMKSIEVL